MAHVVIGGRREVEALAFGQQHPGTLQFLQTQLEVPSMMLTQAGQQFFANAGAMFEQFNGAEAIRAAKAAIRKVEAIFQPNVVRELWDLPAFQTAALTMQRWVMAQPTIRAAYHQQRIDGYSDTYVDMHPGQIGRDHLDWRMVNEGMLHEVDDPEKDYDTEVSFFFDDLPEGDRPLSAEEKTDVLNTWEAAEAIHSRGEDDITSAFGGKQ